MRLIITQSDHTVQMDPENPRIEKAVYCWDVTSDCGSIAMHSESFYPHIRDEYVAQWKLIQAALAGDSDELEAESPSEEMFVIESPHLISNGFSHCYTHGPTNDLSYLLSQDMPVGCRILQVFEDDRPSQVIYRRGVVGALTVWIRS